MEDILLVAAADLLAPGKSGIPDFLHLLAGLVVILQIGAGDDTQKLHQIQIHGTTLPGDGQEFLFRDLPAVNGDVARETQVVQSYIVILNRIVRNAQSFLRPHFGEDAAGVVADIPAADPYITLIIHCAGIWQNLFYHGFGKIKGSVVPESFAKPFIFKSGKPRLAGVGNGDLQSKVLSPMGKSHRPFRQIHGSRRNWGGNTRFWEVFA